VRRGGNPDVDELSDSLVAVEVAGVVRNDLVADEMVVTTSKERDTICSRARRETVVTRGWNDSDSFMVPESRI